MREVALTLEGLEVGYDGRAILPPCDGVLRRGEVWALVGRNGSGKSSLLRTLVGALAPIAGRVRWPAGLRISWVPQRDAVDPSVPMRVVDIVRSGLDWRWTFLRPWSNASSRRRMSDALAAMELGAISGQAFSTLSEGQKQRVLMARALVSEPDVLVLDEPTSAMDPMSETATLTLVDAVRQDRGLTVILASHHAQVIPSFADGAIFVDRDDQAMCVGSVEDVVADPAFMRRYGAVDCFHTGGT